MTDGTKLKAKVIGRDAKTDLALLKVEAGHTLPFVPLGDSDSARVGRLGNAIGNPYNFGGTVTAGIISARSRNIGAGQYDDFIQTDAAINKGNSGGPMFNMKGEVIGINTAIYSPSGASVGIGFAVPTSLAKPILMQLKSSGHIKPRVARREDPGSDRRSGRQPRHEEGRRRTGRRSDQGQPGG